MKEKQYRWLLLLSALAVMMVISIYQYSWFLFSFKIREDFGWSLAALGLVYTIFHYTSTLILPFSGYIADTFGPRRVAFFAALMVGGGFILCSLTQAVWPFYFFYGFGGFGGGVLYGISTSTAIKWFPDKRGFATGLVVFGFGAGTALFNLAIEKSLMVNGLALTFKHLGIMVLVILVPLSLVYRYPEESAPAPSKVSDDPENPEGERNYKPLAMLKTYQWYVIYFSFSFTISIVLIFGAQMKLLSREYALPETYFKTLLVLFPLANGLSRVMAGYVSDIIGRAKTMVIFYTLLGVSIFLLVGLGTVPILFFLFVIITALLGGAPFALYPATIGDFYGAKYATINYGITYTAKAIAGLISGWLSGYLVMQFGSFRLPLVFIGILSLVAAVISLPKFMKVPGQQLRRRI